MLPCLFVENFGSIVQFPGTLLTGNEELAGHPAASVADGRRDPNDYWSPITPNNPAYLNYVLDRPRAADMLALDRGHNLAGATLSLQCSNDNWNTTETIFTVVLPSVAQPGGDPDDALGVTTEEGAWLKRFPLRVALYWRVSIAAMGAGLLPNIVGCWLGKGFYPNPADPGDWLFHLPVSAEGASLQGMETVSEAGWLGRGQQTSRKEGSILLKLVSDFNYDLARYHVEALFGMGRPMWVMFDDNLAERAFLAARPQALFGFRREPQWFPQQALIPYVEWEPLRP